MTIQLADGYTFGNGYIEAFPGPESYRPVDDANAIEVAFVPTRRSTRASGGFEH